MEAKRWSQDAKILLCLSCWITWITIGFVPDSWIAAIVSQMRSSCGRVRTSWVMGCTDEGGAGILQGNESSFSGITVNLTKGSLDIVLDLYTCNEQHDTSWDEKSMVYWCILCTQHEVHGWWHWVKSCDECMDVMCISTMSCKLDSVVIIFMTKEGPNTRTRRGTCTILRLLISQQSPKRNMPKSLRVRNGVCWGVNKFI